MKSKIKLILLVTWIGLFSCRNVYAATYPAILDWSDRVELSLPTSGPVDQVKVVEGQVVKRGTLLLTLGQPSFQANLIMAKSHVTQEQESQAEAKRELDRGKELFDRTSISVRDFKLIQIAFAQADAKLRGAQAALVKAQIDLKFSRVTAPYDALVLKLLVQKGQAVSSRYRAAALMVVARANKMIARTQLSASQLTGLKTGDKASVIINGKTVAGRIKRLAMEPVPGQQQAIYDVDVEFDREPDSGIRKGQSAKIVLP